MGNQLAHVRSGVRIVIRDILTFTFFNITSEVKLKKWAKY